MTKISIKVNKTNGRPKGSTKTLTKQRNGYIIKAYRLGMRKKIIAKMFGLSIQTVNKTLKNK